MPSIYPTPDCSLIAGTDPAMFKIELFDDPAHQAGGWSTAEYILFDSTETTEFSRGTLSAGQFFDLKYQCLATGCYSLKISAPTGATFSKRSLKIYDPALSRFVMKVPTTGVTTQAFCTVRV